MVHGIFQEPDTIEIHIQELDYDQEIKKQIISLYSCRQQRQGKKLRVPRGPGTMTAEIS
jgi:hypothetical protein